MPKPSVRVKPGKSRFEIFRQDCGWHFADYQSISCGRYACSRRRIATADEVCGGLSARVLDEVVTRQVLQALSPAALELSLCAAEHTSQQRRRQGEQLRQNLDRATYETERAERQYQAVEPANRLVARTLEERWETTLQQQRAAQDAYDRFHREKPIELTAAERRSLEELSGEIPSLWHAPSTTSRERKEVVRCLIERVDITMSATDQQADVAIGWAGGFESRQRFRRPVGDYARLDDLEKLMTRLGELRRAGWRARASPSSSTQKASTRRGSVGHSRPMWCVRCSRVWRQAAQGQSGPGTKPPRWPADVLGAEVEDIGEEAQGLGATRMGAGDRAALWRRMAPSGRRHRSETPRTQSRIEPARLPLSRRGRDRKLV